MASLAGPSSVLTRLLVRRTPVVLVPIGAAGCVCCVDDDEVLTRVVELLAGFEAAGFFLAAPLPLLAPGFGPNRASRLALALRL